ncbi:DUF4007 family protein [Paenibacillus thalictri]|uniref:DUF4007 family protein n=1 Tax=Paenibacillus thalictri TaxID=2527873 RepID=A0A4Q9DXQ4_9BACL|nr:DUF4007 family protein [Paenibacillus thalictri]TBL80850.1 DUF4007 family protein [Paenibacillus thalictri]
MRFGHHQSFYLRVNWLSKAIRMLLEDEQGARFFYDDFGFERIGLGRNMVKSLKFWSLATGVIAEAKNEEGRPINVITPFGQLMHRHDRFIRLPLTSGLLHYFLASNRDQATTWYWFFNEYASRSATNEELHAALTEWTRQQTSKTVSAGSLKKDLDCLRQLYTIRSRQEDDPEEVVASPLTGLHLLHEIKEQFVKRTPELMDVSIEALYFALLVYCQRSQVSSVTLEELQYKPLLWGKMFNLSSNHILDALTQLEADPRYPVHFVRTNQIYNLTVEAEDPYAFLEKAYEWKAAAR